MKYVSLIFGVLLFTLLACENKTVIRDHAHSKRRMWKQPNTNGVKKDTVVARFPKDTSTEKTVQFTGKVMATNAYCGGAYPNEELLKELQHESPYQHQQLLLVPVGKGKVVSFKTDRNGNFSVNLVPGSYKLCPGLRSESAASGYNPNCKLWLDYPLAELVIPEKKIYAQYLHIEIPCDPCDPTMRTRP